MRYPTMLMLACLSLPLAACGPSDEPLDISARPALPEVPADIQDCFSNSRLTIIPDRDLTVADVERLWASDRMRVIVQHRCGSRFLEWYGKIKAGWV